MSYDVSYRLRRFVSRLQGPVDDFGEQALFYGQTMRNVPNALTRYRKETIRLVAEMTLGAGALVMIGGTVGVAAFLTLASGGVIAVQGYSSLGNIGIEALTGFLSAFLNVRVVAPVIAGIALAATIGAGATAICADLGARTIRDEIDAMRVLGIDPIQRLVVPRVLASTLVALLLNGLVCAIGLSGGYVFSVFLQGVNPGAFINGLTVLTGLRELILAEVKALLFGLMAGLVGCYRGLTVKGGPKGVGNAVNETVVYAFICLFVINVVATAIGVRLSAK